MAKRETTWLRNETAVAEAIGLALYDEKLRRSQRRDQLAAVKAITAAPDFPPREPVKGAGQMWRHADVIAWGAANLELSQNRRTFSVLKSPKPKVQSPKSGRDLPTQDKPAGDGDLFLKESKSEQFQRTLDGWEEKLLFPEKHPDAPIRVAEINMLKEHRPWIFKKLATVEDADLDGADFVFPAFVTKLETLAAYYKKKFEPAAGRQFSCNKQTIKHWQAGAGVPRNKEWHPAADAGGRFWLFTNQNCFKWFEETMLPLFKRAAPVAELNGLGAGEPLRDIMEERERIERKEILLRDAEIERALGNLLEMAAAEQVFKGFALRADAEIDQFVTSKATLRATVATVVAELLKNLQPSTFNLQPFLQELDDRLARELERAYDALKLKFAAAQTEQLEQIKALAKPPGK